MESQSTISRPRAFISLFSFVLMIAFSVIFLNSLIFRQGSISVKAEVILAIPCSGTLYSSKRVYRYTYNEKEYTEQFPSCVKGIPSPNTQYTIYIDPNNPTDGIALDDLYFIPFILGCLVLFFFIFYIKAASPFYNPAIWFSVIFFRNLNDRVVIPRTSPSKPENIVKNSFYYVLKVFQGIAILSMLFIIAYEGNQTFIINNGIKVDAVVTSFVKFGLDGTLCPTLEYKHPKTGKMEVYQSSECSNSYPRIGSVISLYVYGDNLQKTWLPSHLVSYIVFFLGLGFGSFYILLKKLFGKNLYRPLPAPTTDYFSNPPIAKKIKLSSSEKSAMIAGFVFLVSGTIFCLGFLWGLPIDLILDLKILTTTQQGEVYQIENSGIHTTRVTHDGKGKSTNYVKVSYRYLIKNEWHTGSVNIDDKTISMNSKEAIPVIVEYFTPYPNWSRLTGSTISIFGYWPILALIFPTIGLFILYYALRRPCALILEKYQG